MSTPTQTYPFVVEMIYTVNDGETKVSILSSNAPDEDAAIEQARAQLVRIFIEAGKIKSGAQLKVIKANTNMHPNDDQEAQR